MIGDYPGAWDGMGEPEQSVLIEIHRAVSALLEDDSESVIDVSTLPLGVADLARLEDALGQGEVEATIEAGGKSTVRETGVSGVWIVEHLSESGSVLAKTIEVCEAPTILRAHREDIEIGRDELGRRLA
ncbi:MAG: hydrogenase expression/formation protein [Alphaproteobacteria bacterium]|nr:hydrogenase expression/formation protein [Alphaproteobacteria bacterium]